MLLGINDVRKMVKAAALSLMFSVHPPPAVSMVIKSPPEAMAILNCESPFTLNLTVLAGIS